MSSLPFISHRLFVAAANPGPRPNKQSPRRDEEVHTATGPLPTRPAPGCEAASPKPGVSRSSVTVEAVVVSD